MTGSFSIAASRNAPTRLRTSRVSAKRILQARRCGTEARIALGTGADESETAAAPSRESSGTGIGSCVFLPSGPDRFGRSAHRGLPQSCGRSAPCLGLCDSCGRDLGAETSRYRIPLEEQVDPREAWLEREKQLRACREAFRIISALPPRARIEGLLDIEACLAALRERFVLEEKFILPFTPTSDRI